MLIDALLPNYDVRARYSTIVPASRDAVWEALKRADFSRWGILRTLFLLRALPGLLTHPAAACSDLRSRWQTAHVTLDAVLGQGFSLLAERRGEELVLGLTGRFWTARSELWPTDADRFVRFSEPNAAQAAWNFLVVPLREGRSELATETRVRCTDAGSRRRFRIYWAFIAPFSGLIRREMLAAVREAALVGSEPTCCGEPKA